MGPGLLELRGAVLDSCGDSVGLGNSRERAAPARAEPRVTWPLIAEVQGVEVVGKAVLLGGLLLVGVPPVGALIPAVSQEPGDTVGCGQWV